MSFGGKEHRRVATEGGSSVLLARESPLWARAVSPAAFA